MATPAATAAPAGYFFQEPQRDRLSQRKDSTASTGSNKSIENPLLGREAPVFATTTNQQQNVATTPKGFPSYNAQTFDTPTYNTNAPSEGLRNRRKGPGMVTFQDEKENRSASLTQQHQQRGGGGKRAGVGGLPPAPPPPPRFSSSLGTGLGAGLSSLDPTAMGTMEHRSTTPRPSPMAAPHTTTTHHRPHQHQQQQQQHLTMVPSTTNCWILAFGYSTEEQYKELLQKCSTYGHVLSHHGQCQPGESNWIAIQYSNELEAKKALCHTTIKLSSNIYCGVQRLDDDDPKLLLHTRNHDNGGGLWGSTVLALPSTEEDHHTSHSSPTPKSPETLVTQEQQQQPSVYTAAISEKDILLKTGRLSDPRESVCNRFMKWCLGIKD